MSEKIQIAIDKLTQMSPLVEKLIDSTSAAEEFDEPETVEELRADNIKLKDLIVNMSKSIQSFENIIEELTEDLENLRDINTPEPLTDSAKKNILDILNKSSLSFLLQVYGDKDALGNLSPVAVPFICNELIDKFELADRSSAIPSIWRKFANSNS